MKAAVHKTRTRPAVDTGRSCACSIIRLIMCHALRKSDIRILLMRRSLFLRMIAKHTNASASRITISVENLNNCFRTLSGYLQRERKEQVNNNVLLTWKLNEGTGEKDERTYS